MPDYVRSPERFRAVAWDGTNGADLVDLIEGSRAGESDFSFQELPGNVARVYLTSFPSSGHTLQLTDLLVAGPFYGTFGTLNCEARVVTAARFAIEFDEAP